MHRVQIMNEGLHRLIGFSSDFLVCEFTGTILHFHRFRLRNDFFQLSELQFRVIVIPCHTREYPVFMLNLTFKRFHSLDAVLHIFEKIQHLAEIRHIQTFIGFFHAGRHAVIKVRHGLSSMLIVLIGLNGNTGKRRIAFDIVRFSEMPMSGRKAALQQFHQINLAAGHRQRVEIHIVNMNVAGFMCLGKLRIDDIALVELFRALRTVLEHRSHRGIAVDIGVFALDLVLFRFLKGQILINLHQLGIHVSDSGALRSVKNIFLSRTGVSVFDQNFFDGVLNLFYGRNLIMADLKQI